jgi:glycosyltransferase involved in cell wall biosynthesis
MPERLPKIAVVVPSYNQVAYLDDCLTSIYGQDYPELEIIVMDGGSSDGSVKVIEKYAGKLTYWQSQPDGGQTQAIVAGFKRSTANYLTWLNSDDVLLPGALRRHAGAFQSCPDADVFYGDHVVMDAAGVVVERYKHPCYYYKLAWLTMPYIAQPGTVFTRRIWERVGGVDTSMQCAFDYDLWFRFMKANVRFVHVGGFVSGFRRHPKSKGMTWTERYARELEMIRERYRDYWGTPLKRRFARLLLMVIQSLSGAYFYTLVFRMIHHHRLAVFKP